MKSRPSCPQVSQPSHRLSLVSSRVFSFFWATGGPSMGCLCSPWILPAPSQVSYALHTVSGDSFVIQVTESRVRAEECGRWRDQPRSRAEHSCSAGPSPSLLPPDSPSLRGLRGARGVYRSGIWSCAIQGTTISGGRFCGPWRARKTLCIGYQLDNRWYEKASSVQDVPRSSQGTGQRSTCQLQQGSHPVQLWQIPPNPRGLYTSRIYMGLKSKKGLRIKMSTVKNDEHLICNT